MCRPGTTKVTTAAELAVLVTAPVLEAEEAGADPVAVAVAAPAALLTGALPSAADADAACHIYYEEWSSHQETGHTVAVAAEPEAAEAEVANATLEATEDSPCTDGLIPSQCITLASTYICDDSGRCRRSSRYARHRSSGGRTRGDRAVGARLDFLV